MGKNLIALIACSCAFVCVGAVPCITEIGVVGAPVHEDGDSKAFDPENAGIVAITAGNYKAAKGDKCDESLTTYPSCVKEGEGLSIGSAVPVKVSGVDQKCCKLTKQASEGLCDSNPDAHDGIYHVGLCKDASKETKSGEEATKDDMKCGAIQVIEFPDGKMILEYGPDEKPCGGGMFLPFFPGEFMWGITGHTFIFFLTLFFSFLGIAIIADVFMAAIEVITSKTKQIVQIAPDGTERKIEFLVWNETIANLTLMALGSSAPEILLSVIETLGLTNAEAEPGGLGPGTIVGSAAFNLLVIIAICVMAIPKPNGDGETGFRKIKVMSVFTCTAIFSVLAYIWLFYCVSDNNVSLAEAIITFLFFPLLVGLAYFLDKQDAKKSDSVVPDDINDSSGGTNAYVAGTGGMGARGYGTREDLAKKLATLKAGQAIPGLLAEKESNMSRKELAAQKKKVAELAVAEIQSEQKVSVMQAKINARRGLTGGKRVVAGDGDIEAFEALKQAAETKKEAARNDAAKAAGSNVTLIGHASASYSVDENKGKITVKVLRGGNTNSEVSVYYHTTDGQAVAGSDYEFQRGSLTFKKGETEKDITVKLIDDNDFEPDETFYVELCPPKEGKKGTPSEPWEFLPAFGPSICSITILNDDKPGTITFDKAAYSASEASRTVKLKLVRTEGSDGKVQVQVKTSDGSAKAGTDYVQFDQTVEFLDSQCEKEIEIELIEDDAYEKEESFTVEVKMITEGVVPGSHIRTIVTICADEAAARLINEVASLMALQLEDLSLETTTWGDQFNEAMNIAGEEGASPGTMDYVMHFLTFGWKVMFATVPPTSYGGGWVTFFVALGYIGILTAFVADIAGIFGCLLGLDDAITAITFVALGTSLPDTFASKTAAVNDDTADASVGNVTGSNSVNVFLGLGLPWLLATIINTGAGFTPKKTDGNKGDYPMIAGSLGFSVVIFSICAIVCILTLYVRRAIFGYELGGKAAKPTGMFFISLWLIYVGISSLEIKGEITSFV